LRDQCGIEGQNKKAFNSGKTGMKAFDESAEKQFRRAGLILLFVGEVGGEKLRIWELRVESNDSQPSTLYLSTSPTRDEHSQIDILTSGFISLSRLPNLAISGFGSLYPVTVAQPSRIFTGFPKFGRGGWRAIL